MNGIRFNGRSTLQRFRPIKSVRFSRGDPQSIRSQRYRPERVQEMQLSEGQIVHLAYKLRENEHPEYGGLELEIADIELAAV